MAYDLDGRPAYPLSDLFAAGVFPLAPSLYDVARLADVDVRVAYVADDPISAARARMLLHLAGRTTVFERPLRASEVLHVAESFFDLERPVVVVLDAVLDHFPVIGAAVAGGACAGWGGRG